MALPTCASGAIREVALHHSRLESEIVELAAQGARPLMAASTQMP
jgi:hypothetical protein